MDDPSSVGQLILLGILLLLSAFFSGSETALMRLSKLRVQHMIDQQVPSAQLVAHVVSQPDKLISTLLVGNNLVNISASAIATGLFIQWYGANGVAIATAVMTIILLIFGEITPKTIAANRPEQIASRTARPITIFMALLGPVASLFSFISTLIIRLLGIKIDPRENLVTEEEIKTFVNIGQQEGVIEPTEKAMIYSIFEFGDLRVGEIMVPRVDIVALPMSMTTIEAAKELASCPFSRIPIYDRSIDHIVGIIHVKDLLMATATGQHNRTLAEIARPALFVPEGKKAAELFAELRKAKNHMAIVLDEYGETQGLVTLEDLIEEIVGEISDEYDSVQPFFDQIDNDTYMVSGSATIKDINERLELNLPDDEADTVAGIVFNRLGRLPLADEAVQVNGMTLRVAELHGRRIAKVQITLRQEQPSPAPEAQG